MSAPATFNNLPAPACVKVIKGLYTDVKNDKLHSTVELPVLEKPSEFYEVLLDGTPCKVFIDVDGEMSNDIPPVKFRELVATIQERFVACDSIIGVRNSSHFEALSIDPKTKVKAKKAKISFTLLYRKQVPSCKMLKDYAVNVVMPELQALLNGVIEITSHTKENALNVDTSVYRTNGKVRCPNAYKIPEQKERISAIVKGTIEDNLIQIIPENCPYAVSPPIAIPARVSAPAPAPAPVIDVSGNLIQPPTPPTVADDIAIELLNGLDKRRYSNYDDWLRIACVVKNENWDYTMFDDICKTMPRYNRINNQEIFKKLARDGKLKQATLWGWLKNDNKSLFDELQKRRKDFYKQLDWGISDIEYAKMFYNAKPDRYFYSDTTGWWEIRSNNLYRNEGVKKPTSILNSIADTLRELIEDQRKNLNPADEKTQERSKELLKEYGKLGCSNTTKNISDFLPELCRIDDFDRKMDADTNLLAFKDKVYDIQTNQFRDISPKDYISKTTGYEIGDPTKVNPESEKQLKKILDDIFPDKAQQDYFVKCLALSFFTNRFEMLYILAGSGGNGKGILTSYILKAGGDYIFTTEQTFLTSIYKGGQANSALASCQGKRIVLVSEPDNGEKNCYMNVEFVKSITGRDEICARFLHQNVKTFEPVFTTLLSCNTKPEIRKLDKGLLRRLSIHPFVCEFRETPNPLNKFEKKLDTRLKDLKGNADFIKAFIMLMLTTAHANKDNSSIEMPEMSKDAVNEYVEENNLFKVWFEARFTKVSIPDELKTKEEKDLWREAHSHKTSWVLREFNGNEETRWSAHQLIGAINFNNYYMKTIKGYKTLFYYAYNDQKSGADTNIQSEEEE